MIRTRIRQQLTALRLALGYRLNRLSVAIYCRSRYLMSRDLYTAEPNEFVESLRVLHRQIHAELVAQRNEYRAKRYAYGYPYQALHVLRVYGARSTEDRWRAYGLEGVLTQSDRILDLGANCGFMSLYSVYRTGCKADCVDINPFMLNIGKASAEALRLSDRMSYINSDLDVFQAENKYTVIFSFAAHKTEDRQHEPELVAYLQRIGSWLEPGGRIVFETHGYESDAKNAVNALEQLQNEFDLDSRRVLFGGRRELFILRKVIKEDGANVRAVKSMREVGVQ